MKRADIPHPHKPGNLPVISAGTAVPGPRGFGCAITSRLGRLFVGAPICVMEAFFLSESATPVNHTSENVHPENSLTPVYGPRQCRIHFAQTVEDLRHKNSASIIRQQLCGNHQPVLLVFLEEIMKKALATLLITTMTIASLAACGGSSSTTTESAEPVAAESAAADSTASTEESDSEKKKADDSVSDASIADTSAAEEAEEENYETGDASKDNPRNQDNIGENELLVVSFGTSYNDNRCNTIGAIEDVLEKSFPEWSVRRAFTSQIIIDHVKNRDGEEIDNVKQALDRAIENGVKKLVIQPTHLMNGLEYTDLSEEVSQYADAFEKISIGEPLLTSDEDFKAVEEAITGATASYDDGQTAVVFMGHGTEADSNEIYSKMQSLLKTDNYSNYYIGTVESTPTVDDVLEQVKAGDYKRVVLRPLMVVAGDHANNDMAGDEEDSWKSLFEAEGYEVECVLEGLGSVEAIQQLYAAHAQNAVDNALS